MFTPWYEIRPKKYLSPGIRVVPLWQNSCNLSCAIPLGICNSNIRLFKKLHHHSVSVAFLFHSQCDNTMRNSDEY